MRIEEVVKVLKAGGVIMHPTETCYGLAADIFSEGALKKLYEVKKMSLDKPVSILVDSLEMAKQYGEFSEKAMELAEKFWPGPLSILVPRKDSLPEYLNSGSEFVSMRYSSDRFCCEMVKALGNPVTTTSANVSTCPQLYEVDRNEDFVGEVDLVVDMGKIEENMPSTIVKVDGGEVEVLRQGGVELKGL